MFYHLNVKAIQVPCNSGKNSVSMSVRNNEMFDPGSQ